MSRGRGRGHPILESLGLGAVSIGAAAGAIGATYKITEFLVKCKKLFHVRGENAVFVRLIDRVQADLVEADRLLALKEVKEMLKKNKGKTLWVQAQVVAMREAIEEMSKYTKKVAAAGWWLGIKTRIWWVLDEYEKLIHREMELSMAREGLLAVIEYLNEFEDNKPVKKESKVEEKFAVEEKKSSRRVIELDYEGRPTRREQRDYREYDNEFVEEDIEIERPRPRAWAEAGFYDGHLDGPLSTRPRFWYQQAAGADYTPRRREVREEEFVSEGVNPLRVHWPTSKL